MAAFFNPSPLIKILRKPELTVWPGGQILIRSSLANRLRLEKGDSVNIACQGNEFYVYAVKHPGDCGRWVAACYPSKGCGHCFKANSVELVKALLERTGLTDTHRKKHSFAIGDVIEHGGTHYASIITKMSL